MKGALLINLGSPDSPEPKDVKRYLGEFLMDERVIDLPKPLRTFLVKGIILNTRPKKSAKAYKKIWWEEVPKKHPDHQNALVPHPHKTLW